MSKKTFEQILGEKLKIKREQLSKSQKDIEFEAAISDGHYGNIERGKAHPNSYTLFKLWNLLDINAEELFKEIRNELNED